MPSIVRGCCGDGPNLTLTLTVTVAGPCYRIPSLHSGCCPLLTLLNPTNLAVTVYAFNYLMLIS